jgi:hypothetical protein
MICSKHPDSEHNNQCLSCGEKICTLCKNAQGKTAKICSTCLQQETCSQEKLSTKIKAKLCISLALVLSILIMAYYYVDMSIKVQP